MAGALRRGAPRSVMARVGRPFTAGARRAFSQVVFDTAFKALQRERVAAVRARLLDQIDAGEVGGKDVKPYVAFQYSISETGCPLGRSAERFDGSRAIADAGRGLLEATMLRAPLQSTSNASARVSRPAPGNIIQSLVPRPIQGMLDPHP